MVLKRMVSEGCIEKQVKDRASRGKATSKAGSGKHSPCSLRGSSAKVLPRGRRPQRYREDQEASVAGQ